MWRVARTYRRAGLPPHGRTKRRNRPASGFRLPGKHDRADRRRRRGVRASTRRSGRRSFARDCCRGSGRLVASRGRGLLPYRSDGTTLVVGPAGHRHQFDGPVRRSAMVVFAMPRAEIDRRGRSVAPLAPKSGEDFCKGPVAALRGQQAQRKDCCALAAVKLKAAIRPVGQSVGEAERRRVHGRRLSIEHKANKNEKGETARARSVRSPAGSCRPPAPPSPPSLRPPAAHPDEISRRA